MKCDTPYWVLPKAALEKVPVPCGKCPPCKDRRVNQWVFRLLQEDKICLSSHFVTLTYDSRTVPISENGFMTLRKKDYQDFMKRLRLLCPGVKLKYYCAGEYGSKRKRPHYHAIIFNCVDSELYNKAWGLGDVVVGTVSSNSIAYTMKYIDKPHSKRLFARDDRDTEFSLMSLGLGKNYLTDAVKQFHQADISRLYVVKDGGYKVSMPRYYREKIFSDSDLRKQVALIQESAVVQEAAERREFEQMYAHVPGYTFEAYKDGKRFGRYTQFYSNQQNRDL